MVKFFADENFPLAVVQELRQLGHDVVTIQEAGRAGQRTPDEEVLRHAVTEDRTILTLNRRHFIRLHQQNPVHSGIIACTVDADFVGQAGRIHEAVGATADLQGMLIRINRPS